LIVLAGTCTSQSYLSFHTVSWGRGLLNNLCARRWRPRVCYFDYSDRLTVLILIKWVFQHWLWTGRSLWEIGLLDDSYSVITRFINLVVRHCFYYISCSFHWTTPERIKFVVIPSLNRGLHLWFSGTTNKRTWSSIISSWSHLLSIYLLVLSHLILQLLIQVWCLLGTAWWLRWQWIPAIMSLRLWSLLRVV